MFYTVCFPVPEVIDGNTLTATVVDLNAWVEYEFRVLAKNSVGVGEPSSVSVRTRTEDAGMVNAVRRHSYWPNSVSGKANATAFVQLSKAYCVSDTGMWTRSLLYSSRCSTRQRGWRRWKQIWAGHHMGGKWSVLCSSLLLTQLIFFSFFLISEWGPWYISKPLLSLACGAHEFFSQLKWITKILIFFFSIIKKIS